MTKKYKTTKIYFMVLQRLQSLYLFLASILMVVFAFTTPVVLTTGDEVFNLSVLNEGYAGQLKPDFLLLIINALIVVLGIIAIFKYRNLSLQLRLCSLCSAFTVTLLLAIGVLVYASTAKVAGVETSLSWVIALPVVALFLFMMAYRGVAHDKKVIHDSESLR